MPTSCIVTKCGANRVKCRGLSFHSIPKPGKADEWRNDLLRIINKPASVVDNREICSRHFEDSCFTYFKGGSGKRSLVPGSLPTKCLSEKSAEMLAEVLAELHEIRVHQHGIGDHPVCAKEAEETKQLNTQEDAEPMELSEEQLEQNIEDVPSAEVSYTQDDAADLSNPATPAPVTGAPSQPPAPTTRKKWDENVLVDVRSKDFRTFRPKPKRSKALRLHTHPKPKECICRHVNTKLVEKDHLFIDEVKVLLSTMSRMQELVQKLTKRIQKADHRDVKCNKCTENSVSASRTLSEKDLEEEQYVTSVLGIQDSSSESLTRSPEYLGDKLSTFYNEIMSYTLRVADTVTCQILKPVCLSSGQDICDFYDIANSLVGGTRKRDFDAYSPVINETNRPTNDLRTQQIDAQVIQVEESTVEDFWHSTGTCTDIEVCDMTEKPSLQEKSKEQSLLRTIVEKPTNIPETSNATDTLPLQIQSLVKSLHARNIRSKNCKSTSGTKTTPSVFPYQVVQLAKVGSVIKVSKGPILGSNLAHGHIPETRIPVTQVDLQTQLPVDTSTRDIQTSPTVVHKQVIQNCANSGSQSNESEPLN